MTEHEGVKIRKITYGKTGFKHGVLLPVFPGSIDEAFQHYSGEWFKDHLDKDGNLFDYIPEKDADYIDEFTTKDDTHFFIGIPNTYAFEGIAEGYEGYPGCELDIYGFEKMLDTNGKEIPYVDESM